MTEERYSYGTGKRKCAVAQVRLLSGSGNIIINGKTLEEAFPSPVLRKRIVEPFQLTQTLSKFNVIAKTAGGGVSGQADAIRHGISRALAKEDETLRRMLREHGLLTRDSRIKERKKYGLKRARKAPQYTKR
jgi:small subunit ribosomal protein S9